VPRGCRRGPHQRHQHVGGGGLQRLCALRARPVGVAELPRVLQRERLHRELLPKRGLRGRAKRHRERNRLRQHGRHPAGCLLRGLCPLAQRHRQRHGVRQRHA
jgi:hypothetical protein